MKDVIIVGGGASGLMCALSFKKNNKNSSALIIEKNNRLGKKILVTGNGRCNLSNLNVERGYNNQEFVNRIFKRSGEKETIKFFNSLGLEVKFENDLVYPVTDLASSVNDVLRLAVENSKTEIMSETEVKKIIKSDKGYIAVTDKGNFESKNIIISGGGRCAEKLLQDFNVKFVKNFPSLVGLKTGRSQVKNLAGIRVKCLASLITDKGQQSERGEVQFKEDGVGGIVIFNLSSKMAREKVKSADLILDLMPEISKEELFEKLICRKENLQYLKGSEILLGLFHKNLAGNIFERAGITELKSEKDILKIISEIKEFKLKITGTYDNPQVYSGGVDVNECNENLELKNYKGLFVIGEALDVDGACGGFNLQWAWSSGIIAGESVCIN